MTLKRRDDPKWKATLSYSRPAPDSMLLDGVIDAHNIHARLQRDRQNAFLLTTRGFHWINEAPFNR